MANSNSPVRVTADFNSVYRLLNGRKADLAKFERAAKQANEIMALKLAEMIQQSLRDAIKEGGRPQQREDLLLKAIIDKRNRKATADGITVGFLGQAWAGEVRKYYQGLEVGTSVHVGRALRGAFLRGGRLVGPQKRAKDARFIQFSQPIGPLTQHQTFTTQRGSSPKYSTDGSPWYGQLNKRGLPNRVPVVIIKKPIKPYRYFEYGLANFRAEYLGTGEGIKIYDDAFKANGIRFKIRAANRGITFKRGDFPTSLSGTSGGARTKGRPGGGTY